MLHVRARNIPLPVVEMLNAVSDPSSSLATVVHTHSGQTQLAQHASCTLHLMLLERTDESHCWSASGGKFEEQIGSKGSADPEQLHYALWTASQLLSGASSKASKRILIFTKDENPAGEAGTFK